MKVTAKFLAPLAAVITAVVGLAGAAQADGHGHMKVRIGTEGAYPPFNYFTSAGELTGFDVDIGNALCAAMQAECEFVTQDWDGMIPALQAGRYDVILASMYITNERLQQVDFTDPYYKAAATLVARKGEAPADLSPAAMAGMTLGAQSGTTQADYLQATYPDADIRLYRTQDEANLDMVNGRLDLMAGDMLPMMKWVGSDDGSCCELVGEPVTDPQFVGYGAGMAVRKGEDDLRQALNAALAQILADGTYQEINDRYFSINIYTME